MSKINNIIKIININQELIKSYLKYAMSVIINRALPDVRDGLKPVHRRILYSMYKNKNTKYKKSARIVGEVMGRYHPHGDSAIYYSIIRMTQKFVLNIPLIKGQGNFGSIDGDLPAHMRYTEIKLSKISLYLMKDLEYNCIKWKDNYDKTEKEPEILPVKFPNILINGSTGIAVGMTTSIPPYNIKEIINSCCEIIANQEINKNKLKKKIPIPDFPTGGIIINGNNAMRVSKDGKGIIMIRSKIYKEYKNKKIYIIIKEIPYQINKFILLKSIDNLIKKKSINEIKDIRDESNKLGIRVKIELKNNNIDFILNKLYHKTYLQNNLYINMLVLNKKKPEIMNVNNILKSFIDFRKKIINKKIWFLLNNAKKKIHILIGIIICIINIEIIIDKIKVSKNSKNAIKKIKKIKLNVSLINQELKFNQIVSKKYYLTNAQIISILKIKLSNLTSISRMNIIKEINKIRNDIKKYIMICNNRNLIKKQIINELYKIKKNNSSFRKTLIQNEREILMSNIKLIYKEDTVVILKNNYLSKVNLINKYQIKNKKYKILNILKDNNNNSIIKNIIYTNNNEEIMFFLGTGKIYIKKIYQLNLYENNNKGKIIKNMSYNNDTIIDIVKMPAQEYKIYNIVFITMNGKIKVNNLNEFKNISNKGKLGMKINKNDQLMKVNIINKEDILIFTKKGKIIKIQFKNVNINKTTKSIEYSNIKLNNHDKVTSSCLMQLQNNSKYQRYILSITEYGYCKKTKLEQYKEIKYNHYGSINMHINNKIGYIIDTLLTVKNEKILIITNIGTKIRISINSIKVRKQHEQGIKIIKLNKNEKIYSVLKIK